MDRTGTTLAENLRRRAGPAADSTGNAVLLFARLDMIEALMSAEPLRLKDTRFSTPDTIRLATAYADYTPRPRRMREPDLVPFLPALPGILMEPSRALDQEAFRSGGARMIGSASDRSCSKPSIGWWGRRSRLNAQQKWRTIRLPASVSKAHPAGATASASRSWVMRRRPVCPSLRHLALGRSLWP